MQSSFPRFSLISTEWVCYCCRFFWAFFFFFLHFLKINNCYIPWKTLLEVKHWKLDCVSSWNLSVLGKQWNNFSFTSSFHGTFSYSFFQSFISKQRNFYENGNIEKRLLLCWYSYFLEHLCASTSASLSRTSIGLNTCTNKNNNNSNRKIPSVTTNGDKTCFSKFQRYISVWLVLELHIC